MLGSISLDMFAVLLGGAVALLPVYASEILKTGPWGLGLLRSAPGVGATAMAILVAHRPLRRRAGLTMLWCVAGFGVCTIIFGLSRSLALSLVALFLLGASDMISVIIRSILVQLATPDEMRGRVNAVDMIFIGVSNELGQFESGLTAHWFGTVPAVVLGGVGTLVVIGIWAWAFPELRNADQITNLRTGNQEPRTGIRNSVLGSQFRDRLWILTLFAPNHRLRRTHVVEAVVDSHHDHMLGRHLAPRRRHRHLKVITRGFRIRQLAHRLHILPIGRVHGIFGALDVGKSIRGAEAHMDLRSPSTAALRSSIRGGVVSTSKRALSRVDVSACPGECEGASEATTSTV